MSEAAGVVLHDGVWVGFRGPYCEGLVRDTGLILHSAVEEQPRQPRHQALEAWALRANIAQRDALYVVLARRMGASLLTADARLAGAPKLGVRVTAVGT